MLKNLRKITSLLLVLALVVLVFGPAAVSAEAIGASSDKNAQSVVYQAVGSSISADMRKSLSSYDIPVKADTKLEIVKVKGEEGTILYVTNQEGALVTKTAMMTVAEDGKLKSFTAEDVARATPDLSADGGTVNPFGDGLQIIFTIGFFAYYHSSDSRGIIQPQMAMFRYVDPNNLYTVSKLIMYYDCHGFEGDFDGINIDTSETEWWDVTRYRITVSRTNPTRNAYYSESDPIADDKALLMYGGDCMQEVIYTLRGVRKSTGATINITDYLSIDSYY